MTIGEHHEGLDESFAGIAAREVESFDALQRVPKASRRSLDALEDPFGFERLEPRILLSATDPTAMAAEAADRPNILFAFADDVLTTPV